jgi:hypothetical protein
MKLTSWTRKLLTAAFLSVAALTGGCDDGTGSQTDDITDIDNSTVERQSIGNCWLYATASWVESMHLTATGTEVRHLAVVLDLLALVRPDRRGQVDEIETGGFFSVSPDHPRARPDRRGRLHPRGRHQRDVAAVRARRSPRLTGAEDGQASTSTARTNRKLVRQVPRRGLGA